jgi:hypothetical protein
MSIPQKLVYQVSRVYTDGVLRGSVDNAGIYFDRLVAEDRLGWWERHHRSETDFFYRVDERLVPEDQWERLRAAAHLCDPVAIKLTTDKR